MFALDQVTNMATMRLAVHPKVNELQGTITFEMHCSIQLRVPILGLSARREPSCLAGKDQQMSCSHMLLEEGMRL